MKESSYLSVGGKSRSFMTHIDMEKKKRIVMGITLIVNKDS